MRSSKAPGFVAFLSMLLIVALFTLSDCEVSADDACPDVPICGGESLDYFFTDYNTGNSISEGMVIPVNNWFRIDVLATAYGQCDYYMENCSPLPCHCEPDPIVFERTVAAVHTYLDAATEGGLNGHYYNGSIFCWESCHVLDSRTSSTTGPLSALLSYPGVYAFTFRNQIFNPECTSGVCPATVEKTATLYAGGDSVNSDCTVQTGKGVGVANGVVTARETDFSLAGGVPIDFTRYYNSKTAQTVTRSYGKTWGHAFDTRLTGTATTLCKITEPDGSVAYYHDKNGDAVFEAAIPKGESSTLTKNPDNGFSRTKKDGTTEDFNSSGYMTAITDRNGNAISLTRDGNNLLTTITDPFGRVISITYDGSNRISQITQPDGRVINYSYYANGTLQMITYPDGTYKTYEYMWEYLTGIKNEKGNYVKKFTYDYNYRAATSSADGVNEKHTITYVDTTHTRVTDSLGREKTYTFDRTGGKNHALAVSGTGCSECGQASYTYDADLNVASSTDANGNVTTFTYDTGGNMLTKTEGYGTPLERTTAYT